MVCLLVPVIIGFGVLLIVVGVGLYYYGTTMERDELVGWFGTYYDSTAFYLRGGLISIIGILLLIMGLLA
jgi:hypothetical protein